MENFKIGDVVILRSDSLTSFPLIMTVVNVEGQNVKCAWKLPDKSNFSVYTFPADALVMRSKK